MKYDDWVRLTPSAGSYSASSARSPEVVDIDNALLLYNQHRGTPTRTDLYNKLKAWIRAKGRDWKKDSLNRDHHAVEVLVKDIIAGQSFWETEINCLTSTPPQPVMFGLGTKYDAQDADGRYYHIYRQLEENSCGPACVKMVVILLKNKELGEDYFRAVIEKHEAGAGYAGSLGSGGAIKSSNIHDWSPTGQGTWFVPEALKDNHILITKSSNPVDLLSTNPKNPAIAVVNWDTGGLHYVVVVGKNNAGNNLVILDPFYGLQYAPATSPPAVYEPNDQNSLRHPAHWHPWVCSCKV